MQEKTWYYEKWVGRHASFPPIRYVNGHFWSLAKVALRFGCAKQSKNLERHYQTHAIWNYKHMWLALNSICNKLPPQRKHAQYANCGFYVVALDISTTLVSSKPQISWFPQHTKAICIRYHLRIFQQLPHQMVGWLSGK